MEHKNLFDISKNNTEPLLTAAEVAYRLHLSRSCTYDLMQSGALPTVHINGCRRVRPCDLESFILRNTHSMEINV